MSELVVGGIIWIACFVGGIGVGNSFKKRKEFLAMLLDFDRYLSSCVANLKLPISAIISQFCQDKGASVQDFFGQVRASFEQSDRAILEHSVARSPLFKKDAGVVISYFSDIGKTGYDAQIALLKHHSAMLEGAYKKAEIDYVSNGKLCYKLGFLLGLAIMILVV
ncbi:MAG: stage III sporulation protein AB [Christensenellales bacterium]